MFNDCVSISVDNVSTTLYWRRVFDFYILFNLCCFHPAITDGFHNAPRVHETMDTQHTLKVGADRDRYNLPFSRIV